MSSGTGPASTGADGGGVFRVLGWARGYDGNTFRQDLVAGVTVAVLLVPQCMAYALLAGVPPIYGLYASLVPLLVYALLGSSGQLAAGVIAIDMLIVHAALAGMAEDFTARWIELAILLTLMVGVVQLVMGFARMGFVVNLLSWPVVVGFTSGAAILIALSQVGGLTGVDFERAQALPGFVDTFGHTEWNAAGLSLGMGLGSLVAILLLRWWKSDFPSVLVVVALTTTAVAVFGLQGAVDVVGDVPGGLPAPSLPEVGLADVRTLVPSALALAMVQFLSVVSLGKVMAARHEERIRPGQELVAVGAANALGAFFKALPVSGSFSRTALNEQSGARTPMSNAVAAGGVALALLLLTPALALVPVPALSAIIVVAALGLLDTDQMRFLWRAKSVDGGVAVLTFVVTLTLGILWGIGTGVAASIIAILYRISRPNAAVLGHIAGTRSFRDVRHREEARPLEGILILRIDASFSFMNAEYLHDLILKRTSDPEEDVRAVVVDASSINDLDTTAADILLRVKKTLEKRDIDLYFGGVKEPVAETLRRSGLYQQIGRDHFFLSPHRAITHVMTEWGLLESYMQRVPGAASPVSVEPGVVEPDEAEGAWPGEGAVGLGGPGLGEATERSGKPGEPGEGDAGRGSGSEGKGA